MKRFIGIALLLTTAFAAAGCTFTLGMARGTSLVAMLHFEGNIVDPPNWEGTGNICYQLSIMGKEDKHDCPGFKTDRPGHFTIDKDITDLTLSGGLVTSTDLYLMVNGQRANGQIMMTENKSQDINGASTSSTLIMANFALPPAALREPTQSHDPNAELHSSLQSLEGHVSAGLAPSVGQRTAPSSLESLDGGTPAQSFSTAAR